MTETHNIAPPADLLAPCPVPAFAGGTFRQLAGYALDLREALEQCNGRLEALRRWARE